jgi:hypothetical protein
MSTKGTRSYCNLWRSPLEKMNDGFQNPTREASNMEIAQQPAQLNKYIGAYDSSSIHSRHAFL